MSEVVEPVENERGMETHPAWGLIGASRVQCGPPGHALFDSEIRHMHTVVVRVATAQRRRDLNRDWLYRGEEFVEVEMSEAQWASFVSSMNTGSGVPCTIRRREREGVPAVPFAPRMEQSMAEVRGAGERAIAQIRESLAAYLEHKTAGNLRSLVAAIDNVPANMEFAAKSLTEHAENVVQKARVDIEAMVAAQAAQLGVEAGSLPLLTPGETEA